MYLEAVFRFYVLLNHFVGHFFFGLVRFGSFSNTIYRNLALALSKLHINVDITVGFFVGQKNYRLMELFTAQQIQSLNELELLVYRYINEHPNTVPFMRIRELAAEAHVSTTTVLHFCKKMGCDGYAQFKWKLKEQAGTNQETHLPDTLNELQNFLWRVGTPEYDAALDEAAGLIARAERVFLVGIGNSGSMAEYGARYLSNLGKFALSVTDPFYPVTVTPNVTMTAVLLSVSGETVQILHLAQQFKARGCSLIAITSSPQSTLAKMADMTLPYYTTARRVGSEKYDLTSQMPALYLLEALAHRVYNRLLE